MCRLKTTNSRGKLFRVKFAVDVLSRSYLHISPTIVSKETGCYKELSGPLRTSLVGSWNKWYSSDIVTSQYLPSFLCVYVTWHVTRDVTSAESECVVYERVTPGNVWSRRALRPRCSVKVEFSPSHQITRCGLGFSNEKSLHNELISEVNNSKNVGGEMSDIA